MMRLLAALSVAVLHAASAPQSTALTQEPAAYLRAREALAAADTPAALAELRELTKAEPDYAPGWGLLGQVLAEKASGVATDFRERREAEEALRAALQRDHDNAVYLFALGKVKRKQQMYLDSRRLTRRALEKLEEEPARVAGPDAAEIWYQNGLYHEDAYLDTWHLVWVHALPVASACESFPTFCLNFDRPAAFNEYFKHAADLSEFGEDDFERMAESFRRALDADPTHAGAFRRLAIHLIDREQHEDALRLARSYARASPASPWGHMVQGLAYQRLGKDSLAEASFERALEVASSQIASHYRDVSTILREGQAEMYTAANEAARRRVEEILWRKSDPLHLTEENEVRVAHLARVTYADLMFEEPSQGWWGSETERGSVYVRYGPPARIWLVRRDISKELTEAEIRDLADGDTEYGVSRQGGGRWIFWNYGWDLPNFVFQKQLRYRHASHQFDSYAKGWEEEVREIQPAFYSPPSLPLIIPAPVQIARFRGTSPEEVALEVHAELPLEAMSRGLDLREGEVETGVFLLDPEGVEIARQVGARVLIYGDATATNALRSWRFRLREIIHVTAAVEALDPVTRRAAVARDSVRVEPFAEGVLALSDLLLADAIRPLAREPARREELDVIPNPARRYGKNQPVHIYWEIYGLRPDESGFATYEVALAVRVLELNREGTILGGENNPLQILGALADAWGFSVVGDDQLELQYSREVELGERDRAIEYLGLDLAEAPPGEYEIRLRVRDSKGDEATERRRRFVVMKDVLQ